MRLVGIQLNQDLQQPYTQLILFIILLQLQQQLIPLHFQQVEVLIQHSLHQKILLNQEAQLQYIQPLQHIIQVLQLQQVDQLQIDAQDLAEKGIGSFQPFLDRAAAASKAAGTALGGIGTGAQAFQQEVGDFMSPYQAQVIDATLAEFDRNQRIQEENLRSQQAKLGVLGAGRAGVQLAELGTGAARERALLQAGLLQQGFGQAAAQRQQDIANRFGLAQAQQGLGSFEATLGGQQQAMTGRDVAQLGTLGALNQAQEQARLDADREAARQAAFLPQQNLDRFAAQITGLMGGYPGQTTQTAVPNPTPLQTALGIGTTLAGIYGATNPTRNLFGPKN